MQILRASPTRLSTPHVRSTAPAVARHMRAAHIRGYLAVCHATEQDLQDTRRIKDEVKELVRKVITNALTRACVEEDDVVKVADLAMQLAEADAFQESAAASAITDEADEAAKLLAIDREETEHKYEFLADTPGMSLSDLEIKVNPSQRSLTIKGDRATARVNEPDFDPDMKQDLERKMGAFERTLAKLPEDADLPSVTAKVSNGVLTIRFSKYKTNEISPTDMSCEDGSTFERKSRYR